MRSRNFSNVTKYFDSNVVGVNSCCLEFNLSHRINYYVYKISTFANNLHAYTISKSCKYIYCGSFITLCIAISSLNLTFVHKCPVQRISKFYLRGQKHETFSQAGFLGGICFSFSLVYESMTISFFSNFQIIMLLQIRFPLNLILFLILST